MFSISIKKILQPNIKHLYPITTTKISSQKLHQLNYPTGGASSRIILTRHTSNLPEMHPSLALLWVKKKLREGKYDRLKYHPICSGLHMLEVQPIIGANRRCI